MSKTNELKVADLERQITAMSRTIEAMGTRGTLDECLQAILAALLDAIKAPAGIIGLINSDGETISTQARVGLASEYYASIPPLRVNEGVIGRAIERGDLLMGENFSADVRPEVREAARREGLQAYAIVPIKMRSEILGVIRVAYCSPHEFTPYQKTTLRIIGQQIGLFIEGYRLTQAQTRRIAELEALNHIGQAISSTLDLDSLMQTFYAEISKILDTSTFLVALYDPNTQTFSMPIHYDLGVSYPPEPRPLGTGLTSYIIEHRQSLLIPDMDKVRSDLPVKPVVRGSGQHAAAWLGVPMVFGKDVLGAIVIQSYVPGAYTEDDQHFLEAVADQSAIAVKNARLYAETRQRANEALSLYNIGVLLASTRDMDGILMAIYDEASKILDTTAFSVALYNEEKDQVQFEIMMDLGQALDKFTTTMAGSPLNAWLISNQQPIFVRNSDSEAYPVKEVGVSGQVVPKSFLGVPLIYKGRSVGAITVQSEMPFAFDEHQKQVLEGIAHLAAPALENARLLRQFQSSIEAQTQLLRTIQELSTPLIPVAEGIVVLPLVGHIDQLRAQSIMEHLLTGIATHQARVVLIDITGVPVVDTVVANSLMQAAKAASLLGTKIMLVGIRPEVAQTIVSLGIDMRGITNFANLQSGIEAALRTRGLQITPIAQTRQARKAI